MADYKRIVSNLGAEPITYREYLAPRRCENVGIDGNRCKTNTKIIHFHKGKLICFFCWSKIKYYKDGLSYEIGKQELVNNKLVKKNSTYLKAERSFNLKEINEENWKTFKSYYSLNTKKARRFLNKILKNS